MGKLLAASDIANGKYPFVAGAQPAIRDDAGFANIHPGGVQIHAVGNGSATCGHQQMTRHKTGAIAKYQPDIVLCLTTLCLATLYLATLYVAHFADADAFNKAHAVGL